MKEILKNLKQPYSFFNKDKNTIPANRSIYAVLKGTYGGEFFTYIKKDKEEFIFLSLPEKIIRRVPFDAFARGIKNGVIEYITRLPKNVQEVVELEYNKLNTLNGHSTTKTDNKSDKRGTGVSKAGD